MEALTMGFALLIAMNSSDSWVLALGGAVAILLLLTPGLLRRRAGWILGSILQFLMIGYAVVVPSMAHRWSDIRGTLDSCHCGGAQG